MKKQNYRSGFSAAFITAAAVGAWLASSASIAIAADSVDSKLEKISDRVTELEVQNRLNRVQFSGVFITHYENLTNRHGLPGVDPDEERVRPWGMYFGLNADFDVTKNLKVYSTIAMSKFFNNEGRAESLNPNPTGYYATYQNTEIGAWGYGGSTPKFDRAFVSYEFDKIPLTLAAGRMPTNNGPPANQIYGQPRSGTYPRYAFNAIFDGVAGAYDFSDLLPASHSFKLRAFYQPFTQLDNYDRTKQLIDGSRIHSSSPQYAFLSEYGKDDVGFAGRFDLMYMHASWTEFYVGSLNGTTYAPLGSTPAGQTEDGSDDALYLGFEDIGKIGLNVSWTGLLYRAVDSGSPDVRKKSFAHFVNVNQRFNSLGGLIVGYEYARTQLYHYLDEWTRLNLAQFGTLQNSINHHVFASYPLADKIWARAGYYRVLATSGDIFQTEEFDQKSVYGELRVAF